MFLRQPRRNSGGGSTQNDAQALLSRLVDHMVKEGEVVRSLGALHPMPGKLGNPDSIAAHLQYGVQVRVHLSGVPLFGIVVNSQKHPNPPPFPAGGTPCG